MENLILNPEIWKHTDSSIQLEIISISSLNEDNGERIIDLLMNNIEIYIRMDPNKYKDVIDKAYKVINEYLKKCAPLKIMNILIGYTNINYIRRFDYYPDLLMVALKVIMDYFIGFKAKLFKEMKIKLKNERECKLIEVILLIVKYFVSHAEEDKVLVRYNKERFEVVDRIIAICLYLVINFDWTILGDIIKDVLKEEANASKLLAVLSPTNSLKQSTEEVFITSLIKLAGRTKGVESVILNTIFQHNKIPMLGMISYQVLISIALNRPKEILTTLGLKSTFSELPKDSKLNILELILKLFDSLTQEAKELLINDLNKILDPQSKSFKELIDNHNLISSILKIKDNNPKLIKMQAELLCTVISPTQPHWCYNLSGTSIQRLSVIEKALDTTLSIVVSEKQMLIIIIKCIDFVYGLEDALEQDLKSEEANDLLIKVIAKLLFLLNRVDALYVSLPVWNAFEQREPVPGRKLEELIHQEREGGILRILLKSICICLKNNKNEISCNLLRYLIFRDKVTKQKIKEYIGNKSTKKSKDKKRHKHQNLINLIFRKVPEADKQHEAINDFYIKKVIAKEYSILDTKKINKALVSKEINYFNHSNTLLLHVFGSIIQLICFDLLKINSYTEMPEKESLGKFIEENKGSGKKLSSNSKQLIQVLADIVSEDKSDLIIKMLTTELQSLIDSHKGKLSVAVEELKFVNLYSSLNSEKNNVKERKLTNSEIEAFTSKVGTFIKCWTEFLNSFLKFVILDKDLHDKRIINNLLNNESIFEIQPMLLFLTQHPFAKFEAYIASLPSLLMEINTGEEIVMNAKNLFMHIKIPKVKLRRDVMISYRDYLNEYFYKKIMKEQQSELGCWFDKSHEKYQKSLFDYVKNKYEKIRNSAKFTPNEFTTLTKSRDKSGRALTMKRFEEIETNVDSTYDYLRHFVLKKMLIGAMFKKDIKEYYKPDFKLNIIKNLFTPSFNKGLVEENKEKEIVADEYAPNELKPYDVEMIRICGSIFGKLGIYKKSIIFHNAHRRSDNTLITANQLANTKMFKEWKFENISEIIVKRYNLIRQAAEFYLTNGSSVLFCFASAKHLLEFLNKLEKILSKRAEFKIKVVNNPENYFAKRQFSTMWAAGSITNFDYLMLLNKYGGRSFNDLNQYPVFPWIIQSYEYYKIDLDAKEVYRSLGSTIASLNSEKMKSTTEKNESLETMKYQFDYHYLPATVAFEYLIKVYPYASLLNRYKDNVQGNNWIFKTLEDYWNNLMSSLNDNRELIPEFFYLPEIFVNHNFRFPCVKGREKEVKKVSDNAILPGWAKKSTHRFIMINLKALENKIASLELHKWIDLIFGEKQQDFKSLNSFNPLLDESYVSSLKVERGNSEFKEIQGSGVNPIKLFNEKHPVRDEKKMIEKNRYTIFNSISKIKEQDEGSSKEGDEAKYGLLTLKNIEENQAIIYVTAFERKVLTIFTSQKLYQTKEGYINVPHEIAMTFEKKDTNLFSFKPLYDNETNVHNFHDSQRCFAARFNGAQVITCRHYDKSWKITDCSSGSIKESVFFHKRMVSCVCTADNETKIITGSDDGVIAIWHNTFDRPVWHASNHCLGVVSIDACGKLDLVMSAGEENTIVIRKLSNGKLIRIIRPESSLQGISYKISHIRFSVRGYVIIIKKCKDIEKVENDYIFVYSVNGEEIKREKVNIRGNVIVVSEDGYEFIVGGNNGSLIKYELLNLKEHKMLDDLDASHKMTSNSLSTFNKDPPSITAMALTMEEGCQQLIFGTNTGRFYIYKYSPRLISKKIFGSFSGLI